MMQRLTRAVGLPLSGSCSFHALVGVLVLARGPRDPLPSLPSRTEIFEQWKLESGPLFSPAPILVAAGVLLVVIAAMRIVQLRRRHQLRQGVMSIFHHVATQAGLDLQTQWLLVRIARHQSLPSPLTLLVCDATLQHHGRAFLQTLSPARRRRPADRLARLRRLLWES